MSRLVIFSTVLHQIDRDPSINPLCHYDLPGSRLQRGRLFRMDAVTSRQAIRGPVQEKYSMGVLMS